MADPFVIHRTLSRDDYEAHLALVLTALSRDAPPRWSPLADAEARAMFDAGVRAHRANKVMAYAAKFEIVSTSMLLAIFVEAAFEAAGQPLPRDERLKLRHLLARGVSRLFSTPSSTGRLPHG